MEGVVGSPGGEAGQDDSNSGELGSHDEKWVESNIFNEVLLLFVRG